MQWSRRTRPTLRSGCLRKVSDLSRPLDSLAEGLLISVRHAMDSMFFQDRTLIGGILRFETMASVVRDKLKMGVNVPEGDLVQFTSALGAALLARQRLYKAWPERSRRLGEQDVSAESAVAA